MQNDENKNMYLPLFRKYRPQSFADVIGQDFTVKALQNAIKLNKIANAYLFTGPRGTGKTSSARIFAKSLNCAEGPTVTPCQKCRSCIDITNTAGLDVIEIDAATNRGIDDAKELISQVQYAPMSGKYKIFIIDEVHMLSKEAFNALLKTFEEPPPNVIFILATTEPHKVIETIVSRCQRFDFRRITIEDIVKRLRKISDLEKINITDEALFTIAKNVSGGMRDSLALLDQASILGANGEITQETIEMLTGKLTFSVLYDLTCKILNEDTESAVTSVENIYEKGSEPRNFVENYIEFLRNAILALSSENADAVRSITLFSTENIEKIKNNPKFSKEVLIYALDKVIEFYKEIKISTNPYLWAELMVIDLSFRNKRQPAQQEPAKSEVSVPVKPPQEPSKLNDAVRTNITASPDVPQKEIELSENVSAPQNSTVKASLPSAENPNLQAGGGAIEIWSDILNKIDSIPAKFFYSGIGRLIDIKNGQIKLGFVNKNAVAQAKGSGKFNPLMKAIKNVLGENGKIEFVVIDENTKIIAEHVKVQEPKVAQKVPDTPQTEQKTEDEPEKSALPIPDTEYPEPQNEDDSAETETYTGITKEMLDAYGGRVVQ